MFCHSCGTEIPEHINYCPVCGALALDVDLSKKGAAIKELAKTRSAASLAEIERILGEEKSRELKKEAVHIRRKRWVWIFAAIGLAGACSGR